MSKPKTNIEIMIEFTIDEIVKLFSCCNQAIIGIEDQIHENHINPDESLTNGISLKGSLDKIYEIKRKLKKSIFNSLGESTKNNIKVLMDITECIKLYGCCNAAIDFEEKTIELLPLESKSITICQESIQKIREVKTKIKTSLNAIYGGIHVI